MRNVECGMMNEELLLWRWIVGLDYLSIFRMGNHKMENLFIFARFYHLISRII